MYPASARAASSPGCRLAQYCMTMAMDADPQPAFTWWTNGTSSQGESAEDAGECNPINRSTAGPSDLVTQAWTWKRLAI